MEENEKTLENAHLPYWTGMGYAVGKTTDDDLQEFKEMEISVELPSHVVGRTSSYGRLISKNAAKVMISNYEQDLREELIKALEMKSLDRVAMVDQLVELMKNFTVPHTIFSKEILLFLLAQRNCEAIKFYYCSNHKKVKSLVLIGVDGNNYEIGMNGERLEEITAEPDFDSSGKIIYTGKKPAIVEVGGTDG